MSRWRHDIYLNGIQTHPTTVFQPIQPDHACQETPAIPQQALRDAFPIPGGRYLISFPAKRDIEIYDREARGVMIARIQGEMKARVCVVTPLGASVVRVVQWSIWEGVPLKWVLVSLVRSSQPSSLLPPAPELLFPTFHGNLQPPS